ncbi:MAG: hypothetical protein JXB24_05540 [Bacteroidales bacterium]|nr:hypothetical protein [Bacteroidales bacterium]
MMSLVPANHRRVYRQAGCIAFGFDQKDTKKRGTFPVRQILPAERQLKNTWQVQSRQVQWRAESIFLTRYNDFGVG